MAIAQSDIEAMRSLMPDVLAHYGVTNLSRNFRSPWRKQDIDPSAKYYQDTNLVTDFGDCTVDVFGLVGKVEGIERFPDQARRVAEIAGYGDVHEGEPSANLKRRKAQRPKFEEPACVGFGEVAVRDYAGLMGALLSGEAPGSGDALEYLHGRGFTDEKLYQNVVGYVPSMDALLNGDGSRMFTKHEPNAPRGYIVIPFPVDETFSTVNYCMLRAVPGNKPPANKELRPTGHKTPLYREWLLTARCSVLYIVEGLLDCLAMEMLIGKPCVGLGGSNMTSRVGQLLYYAPPETRPEKVILALDADDAGRKAAEKIANDLDSIGVAHSAFKMPEGCKDPNDILMQIGGE